MSDVIADIIRSKWSDWDSSERGNVVAALADRIASLEKRELHIEGPAHMVRITGPAGRGVAATTKAAHLEGSMQAEIERFGKPDPDADTCPECGMEMAGSGPGGWIWAHSVGGRYCRRIAELHGERLACEDELNAVRGERDDLQAELDSMRAEVEGLRYDNRAMYVVVKENEELKAELDRVRAEGEGMLYSLRLARATLASINLDAEETVTCMDLALKTPDARAEAEKEVETE